MKQLIYVENKSREGKYWSIIGWMYQVSQAKSIASSAGSVITRNTTTQI